MGNIQDLCANNVCDILENLPQPIGIISFIDVLDISLLLFSRGVANIIDIET
jgi:hypothetical protein